MQCKLLSKQRKELWAPEPIQHHQVRLSSLRTISSLFSISKGLFGPVLQTPRPFHPTHHYLSLPAPEPFV